MQLTNVAPFTPKPLEIAKPIFPLNDYPIWGWHMTKLERREVEARTIYEVTDWDLVDRVLEERTIRKEIEYK